MPGTTEPGRTPLRQRLGWFLLYYLAGLIAAGAAVLALRWLLGWVFAG